MFSHVYECASCKGHVKVKSVNPWNPLKDTLHTHGGVMKTSDRKEDPFLAGADIEDVSGNKGGGCAGGLMYKGHAPAPPDPKVRAPAGPVDDEASRILKDMNRQFREWDGTKTNRGAYWGAPRPGSKQDAKKVPTATLQILRNRCVNTKWRFSDSFSSGISFHRTGNSEHDFIYHMKPPA